MKSFDEWFRHNHLKFNEEYSYNLAKAAWIAAHHECYRIIQHEKVCVADETDKEYNTALDFASASVLYSVDNHK